MLFLKLQPDQSTPLHIAAKVGFIEGVKKLLENDADIEAVDKLGFTPLLSACKEIKENTANLLIEAGANVNHITYVS